MKLKKNKWLRVIYSFIITFIIGSLSLYLGLFVIPIIGILREVYYLSHRELNSKKIGYNQSYIILDAIGFILAIILLMCL